MFVSRKTTIAGVQLHGNHEAKVVVLPSPAPYNHKIKFVTKRTVQVSFNLLPPYK